MLTMQDRLRRIGDVGVSLKTVVAEMIGVSVFVFIVTLAMVMMPSETEKEMWLTVGLASGLGLMVMTYTMAHSSGGHINPAITIALMASGVTPAVQAMATIVGQLLGGVVASLFVVLVVPHRYLKGTHIGASAVPYGVPVHNAFLAELVGTFILSLVVLETAWNSKSKAMSAAPLAVGFTFTALTLVLGPLSSCSLNPARSFGPALVSMHFHRLWLYIVAPTLGALLAVPMHLLSVSGLDTIPESQMVQPGVPDVENPHISNSSAAVEPLLPGNRS